MNFVALIPLRGGSKGIPGKNIRPIGGKPMAYWVIEAAHGCEQIERIFVATDSDEIRRSVEALKLPRVEVIARSDATATDTASTESVMLEFAANRTFKNLILIQATSPLLRTEDLRGGIAKFESERPDSLLSVVEQKRYIWSQQKDGKVVAQNYDPQHRPRRQDFESYYVENGAFYICSQAGLIASGNRLHGKSVAYVMPEESYYELDEISDWVIIDQILKNRATQLIPEWKRRLGDIKLVVTDVDGVLTDAGMYYSEKGDELKKFNTRDGKGAELLRHSGYQIGIITSENTSVVARRASKLQMNFLYQGVKDKVSALNDMLIAARLQPHQVAYIGDDLNDLDVLKSVGFAACPANAISEVKSVAHYHCQQAGGAGAYREFAEIILSGKNSV